MTNENKRVTSTARTISRSWFRRLFGTLFWIDLLIVLSLCLGFALYHEKAALGESWEIGIPRSLELYKGRDLWESLRGSHYVFWDMQGEQYVIPVQAYYDAVSPFCCALLILEGLMLAKQLFFGGRRARKQLRPLNEMAQRTRELLDIQQRFGASDGEKLHDLEDKIKSMRPEETLRTGDRDLQGLESAINSLLARMHESYRQQTQFVSDASHELRTPIAVIQGYAGMLDRWGKSDEKILDESIAAIKSESEYMKKLVDQLLFLARGDMGRARMEKKRMSVSELIKEVYEDSTLIDRKHDWRIETEPDVFAIADHDMLKQCARILSDNAAKYTPEGGMIRLRAKKGPNGEAMIEVQDSGIGIPKDDVKYVFDRFYRSDPARGRNSGGTGLGLAIAKWIIESHDGHFEVLSREGIGTRFTAVLPNPDPI